MSNIFNDIIIGWKNYTFPNKEVEEIAKNRILTCLDCENLSKIHTCRLCGCFMPAKVRNPISKCPAKLW